MITRKHFLHLLSLALPAVAGRKPTPAHHKPIVVATWASGEPVVNESWKVLQAQGTALDAIEKGANYMELQRDCCVGLQGYPDRDGIVTLDASIMDHQMNCGAVAGIERILHPISVARRLMEKTPHVLLVGEGAQQFALQQGFTLEPAVLSEDAKKAYEQWLKKSEYQPTINIESQKAIDPPNRFENGSFNHDTMGILAIDEVGNLSGGVTTSGMAFKMHGRAGDSPIIGAGLYVDNAVGAATSSGLGEEVIRICGTHLVVEFMRQGNSPTIACKKAIHRIISRDPHKARNIQVGFLAINRSGQVGAWSIQKGFEYCIRSATVNKVYQAGFSL